MNKKHSDYIWTDKKRTIFGLPISLTRYFLTEKKIIRRTGFFNITEDEINIYKITDKKLTLSFGERIFGCGTITIFSKDTDTRVMDIKSVKDPYRISELIDEALNKERDKYGIRGRDMIPDPHDHDDCFDCPEETDINND
ncbi:MAG: PH domain-containing protein [Oscillospiraceae bacterium]|nr:PH domain-containing protein [Oscillospiraceae bacterium]